MVTFLITSVVILGIIAIAIYFWQKPASRPESVELPPPRAAGLFAEDANIDEDELNEPNALTTDLTEQQDDEAERQAKLKEFENFVQTWRESPDKKSTATMLHLAASTNDAGTYCVAVELALNTWQSGSIPDLSAVELQTVLNSQYWLLSSSTRSSGAGFVLKRTLSQAKRELESSNNNQPK